MAYSESKALLKFDKTFKRSINLIKVYLVIRRRPTLLKLRNKDLVRASVVFCVASMDAYFTDKFIEHFIPYMKKYGPTDGMVSLLEKAGLDIKEFIVMLSMKRPYRRVRTLIQNHLENYVTQNFSKIDELFLAYGLKDFSKNVQGKIKRKQLLRSIEILIERRHRIVHEGDLDSNNKIIPINLSATLKRIEKTKIFITACDEFLYDAFKL